MTEKASELTARLQPLLDGKEKVLFLHATGIGERECAEIAAELVKAAGPGGTVAAMADSPAGRALMKLPGAKRSSHPSHAVAVAGRRAAFFTAAHGRRGRRRGPFGDKAFAAESPFEKLTDAGAFVIAIGERSCGLFLAQLTAHRLVNRYMYPALSDPEAAELLTRKLKTDPGSGGSWPCPDISACEAELEQNGLLHTVGWAVPVRVYRAEDFLSTADCAIESEPEAWLDAESAEWIRTARKVMNNGLRDFAYEAELRARFRKLLPARIADSHFHVSLHYGRRAEEKSWYASLSELAGSRIAGGLMMDSPSAEVADDFEGSNIRIIRRAKRYGCRVGMVTPACVGFERAKAMIEAYPADIRCIKPYFTYAPAGSDRFDCDMLDFAPEWMFRLANEKKLAVLIHLSHYAMQCADPRNIAQIREMALRYPDMKLVLAHCAMGHNADRLRRAIPKIADLPNVFTDVSGISDAVAIQYCIRYLGTSRMMYGGDYSFSDTLGKITGQGGAFFAVHAGSSRIEGLPRDYRFVAMPNLYEGMLALTTALELEGASRTDYERIFYRNHKRIYG